MVLLSAGFWKRRFAADPEVVGRKITLNDRSVTIIGVIPPSFDFTSVFAPGTRVDLLLPLPLTPALNREGNTLSMIGRLKPGVSASQAQAEANVLSESIRARNNRGPLQFTLTPLEEHVRGRLRPALLVLVRAVGAVLPIACANLSHWQLSPTATRQKEMAIRVALGAGRSRLIRQMQTESLVLSCAAGTLGLLLAALGTQVLAHLDGVSIPLRESVRIDGTGFAFTLLIAILTGAAFSGSCPRARFLPKPFTTL